MPLDRFQRILGNEEPSGGPPSGGTSKGSSTPRPKSVPKKRSHVGIQLKQYASSRPTDLGETSVGFGFLPRISNHLEPIKVSDKVLQDTVEVLVAEVRENSSTASVVPIGYVSFAILGDRETLGFFCGMLEAVMDALLSGPTSRGNRMRPLWMSVRAAYAARSQPARGDTDPETFAVEEGDRATRLSGWDTTFSDFMNELVRAYRNHFQLRENPVFVIAIERLVVDPDLVDTSVAMKLMAHPHLVFLYSS